MSILGEPPIKRKLLPEFDRSEGPDKSCLKASRTTPEGNYVFLEGYFYEYKVQYSFFLFHFCYTKN